MKIKSAINLLFILGISTAGLCIYFSFIPNYEQKSVKYLTETNNNLHFGIIGLGIISAACFCTAGYLLRNKNS